MPETSKSEFTWRSVGQGLAHQERDAGAGEFGSTYVCNDERFVGVKGFDNLLGHTFGQVTPDNAELHGPWRAHA